MSAFGSLPIYQCHKKVAALQIDSLHVEADGVILNPSDKKFLPIKVSRDWWHKHNPKSGGYYVRYEDGYESYSPAHAFESGYTKL